MAELQSQLELNRDMARPLVASPAPTPRTFDPDDPNLVSELQNLELNNMDLQVTDGECCQASSFLFLTVFSTAYVENELTPSFINYLTPQDLI